jgi:hypothetical protein
MFSQFFRITQFLSKQNQSSKPPHSRWSSTTLCNTFHAWISLWVFCTVFKCVKSRPSSLPGCTHHLLYPGVHKGLRRRNSSVWMCRKGGKGTQFKAVAWQHCRNKSLICVTARIHSSFVSLNLFIRIIIYFSSTCLKEKARQRTRNLHTNTVR